MSELDPEDAKLITLARATRARSGAAEGAAVRDTTGRTYTATTVTRPHLEISALQLATAMAVSSGADGLEAAAVVTDASGVAGEDAAAVRDLGVDVPILVADSAGTFREYAS